MRRATMVLCTLLLALPLAARAHDQHDSAGAAAVAAAEGSARAAYLFVFDDTAKKLTDLAQAFPEESYAWRPAAGVRSVGEAFQHVSGSVYFLTLRMGMQPPEGHPQSFAEASALEKTTSKAEVAAALARAIAFARQAAEGATPELLAKRVDAFGKQVDGQTLFLLLQGHLNEHLGQLIAYARMNGVVPPWSRGEGN